VLTAAVAESGHASLISDPSPAPGLAGWMPSGRALNDRVNRRPASTTTSAATGSPPAFSCHAKGVIAAHWITATTSLGSSWSNPKCILGLRRTASPKVRELTGYRGGAPSLAMSRLSLSSTVSSAVDGGRRIGGLGWGSAAAGSADRLRVLAHRLRAVRAGLAAEAAVHRDAEVLEVP
jgi:hypothetical protein